MPSTPTLRELAALVAALRASDGTADARRAALRALARAARRAPLELRVGADGAALDGRTLRGPVAPPVAELLALLRAAGVAELRVRKHAGARELAQLAGALARHDGEGQTGHLADELTALRLWSVRAIARRGQPPAADDGAGAAIRAAVRRLLAAPNVAQAVVDAVVRGTVDADAPLVRASGEALTAPLVDALRRAASFDERRRVADALLALESGEGALVVALADDEWFVVRNVALVLGELRAEGAVRPLARLLMHADDRVRAAAAVTLGQIGTAATRRPLLGALRDRSADVRRVAARTAVEAARGGVPLSPAPLLDALHAETDADAASEIADALAAINSVEARQALAGVASRPPMGVASHVPWLAAVEAMTTLARAGDGDAAAIVRALAQDADGRVRHAVRNAMQCAMLREAGDAPPARRAARLQPA